MASQGVDYTKKLTLPAVPQSVTDRGFRAASEAQRNILLRQIQGPNGTMGSLASMAEQKRDVTRKNALQQLKGMGNYSIGDNPDTPEVERNAIFRNSKQLGEQERQAVNEQARAATNKGLGSSSFRDKAVGAALGQMSLRAQEIVSGYASEMSTINTELFQAETDVVNQLTVLYGEEADYLMANPKLPSDEPAPEETPAATQPAAQHAKGHIIGPWTKKPNLDATKWRIVRPGPKSPHYGKWVAERK